MDGQRLSNKETELLRWEEGILSRRVAGAHTQPPGHPTLESTARFVHTPSVSNAEMIAPGLQVFQEAALEPTSHVSEVA